MFINLGFLSPFPKGFDRIFRADKKKKKSVLFVVFGYKAETQTHLQERKYSSNANRKYPSWFQWSMVTSERRGVLIYPRDAERMYTTKMEYH